jgi:hypothetical protein
MQKLEGYRAQLDPRPVNKLPAFDFQVYASPHEKAALEYKEELHEEVARSGGTLCLE